jgi:hypothetical protein
VEAIARQAPPHRYHVLQVPSTISLAQSHKLDASLALRVIIVLAQVTRSQPVLVVLVIIALEEL